MDASSEERDNFFRMTLLLFRVGNQRLREFFKSQWPIVYQNKKGTPPPAAWTDIPNDAVEMKNIESRLLRFQYPDQEISFNSGDTKKWDFTLLTAVFNKSTLGFVTPSSPESNAIKELKKIRNELICHAADATIPDVVYNTEWPKACHALRNVFNATQEEIDQVVEDVKKPVDTLLPIVKECLNYEEEILNSLYELEKSNEIRHNETLTAYKEGTEDIKETINLGFQQVKDAIEGCSEPKVKTDQKQQIFVGERLKHFQNNVVASELFSFLPCLPDEKRESIEYFEKMSKPIQAVRELVEFLEEKGDIGLQMLVNALAKAGYEQVALLLDPDFEDHMIHEQEVENTQDKMYTVIAGTAIDIFITLRFMDEQKRLLELEKEISLQFSKQQLTQTKKIRSDFTKVLPKGVYFVETKQLEEMQPDSKTPENGATGFANKYKSDSVVVVFRVAKAQALEELWEQRVNLKEELKRVLVGNVALEGASSDEVQDCRVEMVFEESDYLSVKKILNDFDSQNDTSFLDTSDRAIQSTAHDKKRFVCKDIPPVYLSDRYGSEIVLRDYQKELAAPAFEGNNTVICAPTNSGKTFVAMEIAKRHLDAHRDTPCKIIFVVEKQNLILQQRLRFQRFLHQHRISDICSYNSSNTSLEELLKSNDVIVLTAQILVNALEYKKVKITDLSLLLFDECHHTDKNHSFRQIMKFYLDAKLQGTAQPENLPQVVGFTASLGVGQSKTIDGAVNHILQVCANHDALIIRTVHEYLDDLNECVTAGVPSTIVITVTSDSPNIFELKVNEAMRRIETSMDGESPPPSDRHLEGYRQWIELKEDEFQINRKRENVVYTKHLRRYHEALLLNYTATIDGAMKLLRGFYDSLEDSMFTETTSWLKELPLQIENAVAENINKIGKPANPLLEALKEKIIEFHNKFKESGEAKGIVFTRTRQYTVALSNCIKEMSKSENVSLKPEVLVGSGDNEVGFTLPQQRAVIEQFRTGDVNIIIATSVAHEGLDITDCNYAISYDMLDSEISFVQSRGRIRAKDGIYVRIVGSRSRSAENEQKVKRNEEMMNKAISIVQELDREEMLLRIIRSQRECAMLRQAEEEQVLAKLQAAPGVKLNCGECDSFVCLADNMRCYNSSNHLAVNLDVFNRIVTKQRDKKDCGKSRFTIKAHCKECQKDLGVILLTQNVQWPCLKIESLIVVLEDERIKCKKWSKAPFKIQKADLEELHRARKALSESLE